MDDRQQGSPGANQALAWEIARLTRVAFALERHLFSTPDDILNLCSAPIDFAPEHLPASLRNYLREVRLDTAMIPAVDCLFVVTSDGSTTLYTYSPVRSRDYYVVREQHWVDPKGVVAVAKHPFHLASSSRPGWNLPLGSFDRVALSPLASLPFGRDTDLALRVTRANGAEHTERLWVHRTFEIRRGEALAERLHLIVRDYGDVDMFGKVAPVRMWYLYSERANTVVRQSPGPIGFDAEAAQFGARPANAGIQGLVYIQDGRFSFIVSSDELRPVRAYLATFDVWKSR